MEKRIFGYARVSSKEQNLDRQVLALKKYVEQDKILVDKASGKDLNREAYQALMLSGKLNDVPSVRLFHADFGTGQACPSY